MKIRMEITCEGEIDTEEAQLIADAKQMEAEAVEEDATVTIKITEIIEVDTGRVIYQTPAA